MQMLRVAHVIERAIEGGAEPFVRIEHQRIRALDSRQRPRHSGRIIAEPAIAASTCSHRPCALAISAMAAIGVDRGDAGRADAGDDGRGLRAGVEIGADSRRQRVRPDRVRRVGLDMADIVAAKPRQQRRLVDGAVGVRGTVDDQRRGEPREAAARQRKIARLLARANQRHQRRGRGGVLDHAAEALGQADELAHPVGHDFFEFGQRGRRLPGEAERAKPRAQIIAEHRGEFAVGGEIAEEAGMVEMRQARQDQRVEIGEDRRKRFGAGRRRLRQRRPDRARRDRRHHRPLGDSGAVIGDAVDQFVA